MKLLRLALDRYDRHFPFFDGTVKAPEGVDLQTFQVGQTVRLRDGEFRHERLLHKKEFEAAEFSFSSFLMAIDRGLDIVGIPIFPRRLFSQGLFYVREDGDIKAPKDLIGRRVGLNAFQTTLSVLARGDLKSFYGIPWESVTWCVSDQEKVPFTEKFGVKIHQLPRGCDLSLLLKNRELDAFIHPHPPASTLLASHDVIRLFPNAMDEEKRYFEQVGFFPIMHVVATRRSLLQAWPELSQILTSLFSQASSISSTYYNDPNWSSIIWAKLAYEEQTKHFNRDPWMNGLDANVKNINMFLDYMKDQNLITKNLEIADLFAPASPDSSVRSI